MEEEMLRELGEEAEVEEESIEKEEVVEEKEEENKSFTTELNTMLFNENMIPDEFEEDLGLKDNDIINNQELINLGLKSDDFIDLYNYTAGRGERPNFIERFTADSEGRLKDMVYTVNLYQLSKLPVLMAYQDILRKRLFSEDMLRNMDSDDLIKAYTAITKDTTSLINASIESMKTFSQLGALNNDYRKILDSLLLLDDEKFNKIKHFLYDEPKDE